jgi:hypothetical protein
MVSTTVCPATLATALPGPITRPPIFALPASIRFNDHYRLNLTAESFNLFNRDNQRVTITSNGLISSASTFVQSYVTTA